jgi:DNA-binding CsgD family transcriptional regulator
MAEPGDPLSDREQDIVKLVATGATNRQIARELSISPNTVKVHLRNIFTKLDISSRTEATVIAIREGWVEVGEGEEQPGVLAGAAPEEVLPHVGPPFVLPPDPLPLFRRFALVAAVVLVTVAMAFTRPRAVAVPAGACSDEFTAECAVAAEGLVVEEPESLWVSLAPMPEPRGRFALVALDGALYIIGGETAGGATGALAIYDVGADSWREGPAKPVPVANLAAVVHQGLVYAIGGRDAEGQPVAIVEIYDPAAGSWSEGVPLPRPLMAHTAVSVGDRVLVFGGSDGTSYTGQAWAFDPAAGRWDPVPALPAPRGFMGSVVLDGSVYLVGGYDGQKEYANCDRFDPRSATFDRCPPMSTPRGGVGAAAVAGNLFVIGGGWESFTAFSERFNPRTDAWSNVETPVLLAGGEWLNLGVIGVGTRIFALGGWQGGRYLNVNQAYETLPNRLYLPATAGGGN